MYMVYVDDQLVYSSDMAVDETAIAEPKLSLEVNTAGSFEFVIHPTHYLYNSINKMKSIVKVLWDGQEVFYGRVLETEVSMYLEKRVTCEGALAFLNDSVQSPIRKGTKQTVTNLVTEIVNTHNSQVNDPARQFTVGTISIGGNEQYAFERTTYEDSRSSIENVMEMLDGYLRVRHEDNTLYLDMLDDYDPAVNQTVQFGVNLADLTVNDQADDLFTAILPVGKNNLVIPENQNGPILVDEDMVAIYGKIVRAVSFDDVTKVADLIQNGTEYLQKNGANIPQRYEIKAVDLHYFDPTKDLLLPGYAVPIESSIHGIDEDELICINCEIDLQNPENNSYTLGIPDPFGGTGSKGIVNGSTTVTSSMTKVIKSGDAEAKDIKGKYDDIVIEANTLKADINRIQAITDDLEVTVGLDHYPVPGESILGSALWADKTNITAVTGNMEVGSDGKVHIKDGSGLVINRGSASFGVYDEGTLTGGIVINKINNTTTTTISGDKVDILTNDQFAAVAGVVTRQGNRISTIEGSTLWTTRDNITAATGTMTVDGQGKLHIKEGSGLYIDRDNTSLGVWDSGNLTAGIIVQKINGDSSVSIDGSRVNIAANTSFQAVASVTGNFTTDENGNVHVVDGSELYLGTGTASLKVWNDGTDAGVVVEKINNVTTTTISGDKVNMSASSEFNSKVSAGDIASSINQTAQSVRISAAKINLDGYVTASQLSATNATISNLMSGQTTATYLRASSLAAPYATIDTLEVNSSLTIPSSFNVGTASVSLKNKQVVTDVGKNLVTFTDISGNQIQFYAVGTITKEWIRYAGT